MVRIVKRRVEVCIISLLYAHALEMSIAISGNITTDLPAQDLDHIRIIGKAVSFLSGVK